MFINTLLAVNGAALSSVLIVVFMVFDREFDKSGIFSTCFAHGDCSDGMSAEHAV